MGYTHYWRTGGFDQEDREGYKKALPIIRQIVERHRGLLCREYDQTDRPPEVEDDHIRFNGRDEDGHETFFFDLKPRDFSFCKTARKPYDLPVCEILLVLKALLPHFSLSSDGFSGYLKEPELDGNWATAIENVRQYGLEFRTVMTEQREPYCDMEPELVS